MSVCVVCGVDMASFDPDRGTSIRGGVCQMDRICNSIVNPRFGARFGSYEDRRDALERLHEWLRGDRPGWGAYRARRIRQLHAGFVSEPIREGLMGALAQAL